MRKRMKDLYQVGVRLVLVLVALSGIAAIVVLKSYRDQERMLRDVSATIKRQRVDYQARVEAWSQTVTREQARQLAAPFLWDVESLDGIKDGSGEHRKLQRRMWQFVYGQDTQPIWQLSPVGPLESVMIIDRDHRIVAASDPMVVDQRFTSAEEIDELKRALDRPVVRTMSARADGQPVVQLTTGVPNSRGELIGVVRLRYVGAELGQPPVVPEPELDARPELIGPLLSGLIALLGVGFGTYATWKVFTLTRRIERLAEGLRLPTSSGSGRSAIQVVEDRLGQLAATARRDDVLLDSLSEALLEGVVLLDPTGTPAMITRRARAVLAPQSTEDQEIESIRAAIAASDDLRAIVADGLERGIATHERSVRLPTSAHQRTLQVSSYVMQDGEKPLGLMLVLKDRGSIEAFEQNLKEASRLAAIGMLTRSVAHEVKNPLGAIGIHLEHLRRRLVKNDLVDPLAEERVKVIREEIDRLHEILREWLRLTSPEEAQREAGEVEDVLDSVARLLRVEARHQGVELIVERAGELGAVKLSSASLRQVLLNLALNGLQAMPQGGRLQLSAYRHERCVILEVADTGSGIPEEIRPRVFDFHFTTRREGSGLGLAISKRMVESVGGEIHFDSVAGEGTTFRVQIPLGEKGTSAAIAS
jgi:signal transduction histidine kinase